MELMDILFVGIGLLCVAASFFLPEKLAGGRKKEEQRAADLKEAVLAELRKKENLDRIVTDALSELSGRMREQKNELLLDSESELDRMSNEKMLAFGEYADELLEKINQNHMEVVFLYDMLKEKESTLKDFAARLDGTHQQIQELLQNAEEEHARLGSIYQQVQLLSRQAEAMVGRYEEIRRKQEVQAEARRLAQARAQRQKAQAQGMPQEQTASKAVLEETAAGIEAAAPSSPMPSSPTSPSQPARQPVSRRRESLPAGQPVRAEEAKTGSQSGENGADSLPQRQPGENRADSLPQHQPGENRPDSLERRPGENGADTLERRLGENGADTLQRRPGESRADSLERRPGQNRRVAQLQRQSGQAIGERSERGFTGNPRPLPSALEGEMETDNALLEEQNDRILRMYRGGMSILEISKMMGLGQGEVKLVVDLFHKAR